MRELPTPMSPEDELWLSFGRAIGFTVAALGLLLGGGVLFLLLAAVEQAKRLLGMPPAVSEAEVVYGLSPEAGQVAVLTHSMLGVLAQLRARAQTIESQEKNRNRS